MDSYFEAFKEKMNNRFRIPQKLVEDYKDDICFMVDSDRVYIQAVQPQVVWVKPLPYEVNIDETKDIIEALINELVDPKAPYFGTYDEAKARIELSIKLPHVVNRGKKRLEKLQTSTPLMLTKGKGEEIGEEGKNEEESKEEEVPQKKKGKVTITKPPKQSTIVFTRRTKKKASGESSIVIFKRPPPTF